MSPAHVIWKQKLLLQGTAARPAPPVTCSCGSLQPGPGSCLVQTVSGDFVLLALSFLFSLFFPSFFFLHKLGLFLSN